MTSPIPTRFKLLPEWYESAGLSAAELAQAIGVDQSTIHELVRHRRWPSAPTLDGLGLIVPTNLDIHFSLRQFLANRRRPGARTSV